MSNIHGTGFISTGGVYNEYKVVDGKPRISAMTYLQDIGEGNVSGHTSWAKIGYTPTMTTTESDLWSSAGVYTFPGSAMQMEVVSTDNTADIGTIIHSGVTTTGGSTTTLQKTGENFLTTTAAGDCIIVDAAGDSPEWGYITSVDSDTQITFSGGLSSGGSGASRGTYAIVDKSATAGAQAVIIEYLDGSYATANEIVVLNGTTPVDTTNTDLFRINAFRVIATGANNKPTGALAVRETDAAPNYSYITAGFTRARNSAYTVPTGKTLYITEFTVSYGYSTNQTHYARLYTRANREPSTGFLTGSLFYPYTEVVCANTSQLVVLDIPTKLPAKTDIKVSGISTFAGIASIALRGWLE